MFENKLASIIFSGWLSKAMEGSKNESLEKWNVTFRGAARISL